ncbi:hypothetical protein F7R02_07730 [Xanthomonas cissicola]|nr:hypothetical protein F7R02_07730 [Xanthomonas cissicola]
MGRAATGLVGINAWRSNGPGRRYLIETDPRFVNYDNFISSDFLLDKLGVDPEWTRRTPILSSTSVLESNSPGDLDMTLPIRTALVEL